VKIFSRIFIFAALCEFALFFLGGMQDKDFAILGFCFLILTDLMEIKDKLDATQSN